LNNMKVGMISLGCDKNRVDAEVMLGLLKRGGFTIVNQAEEADIIIVNTCGLIDPAKEESIDAIVEQAQYKSRGSCKLLIVTGCLAQRYSDQLISEIPEIDAVVGTGKYTEILQVIKRCLKGGTGLVNMGSPKLPCLKDVPRVLTTPSYTAYLKISEGCSNCCSYCVIPQLRGRHTSRPMDEVLAEAQQLVENGVREIILVGQDLTRYGQDLGRGLSLAKLLGELVRLPRLTWLRLLYCYPDRVTDELIDIIGREDKICNYLDIPLQHINPLILKRMNRHFSPAEIRKLIAKLRERIPRVVLRTSFIVGFPGEGEEEFRELLDFVEEIRFDRLGVFAYSREEGTPAAVYTDQINEDTKERRKAAIMDIQRRISKKLNRQRVGQSYQVLIEGIQANNIYVGRSYGEAPEIDQHIYVISEKPLKAGEFVEVRITKAYDYDLLGETYESSK
jgi:ribosomal protein S12 methylthiotransferase